MGVIELNAEGWHTIIDFYSALLEAISAPPWHGKNVNALVDSLIWGGINHTEPPYNIKIHGLKNSPVALQNEIKQTINDIMEARTEYQQLRGQEAEVSFHIT